MDGPLMLNGVDARAYLGLGRDTFRRLTRSGVIPSWVDVDTGTRWYFRPALDRWAAANGQDVA